MHLTDPIKWSKGGTVDLGTLPRTSETEARSDTMERDVRDDARHHLAVLVRLESHLCGSRSARCSQRSS